MNKTDNERVIWRDNEVSMLDGGLTQTVPPVALWRQVTRKLTSLLDIVASALFFSVSAIVTECYSVLLFPW